MAERSGGSYRTKSSKPYDHSAGNQITGSTQYHAEAGDQYAEALLRRMYDPAPGIAGPSAARTHD